MSLRPFREWPIRHSRPCLPLMRKAAKAWHVLRTQGVRGLLDRVRAAGQKKWTYLAESFRSDKSDIAPARSSTNSQVRGTILVVDSFVPFDDRSAGARRHFAIMRMMRDLHWKVTFLSDDSGSYEPYAARLREAGIEVILRRGSASNAIEQMASSIDIAWVSRAPLLEKYLPCLRATTRARVVFDTVDLHFLRLQRQMDVTGDDTGWTRMRDLELGLMRRSDCTIVTSGAERLLLSKAHIPAYVIPIIEGAEAQGPDYVSRSGALFLGNYSHKPNVDAAAFLVNGIMPLLWRYDPDLTLTLAGDEPSRTVRSLAKDNVRVTGYVKDLRALFDRSRVFVAPLRYGAGIKGKIIQALAHGVPIVTSSIGAEGIGLQDEHDALIADEPQHFANAISRIYRDEELWNRLSRGARESANRFTPAAVRPDLETVLAQVATQAF